MGLSAHSFQCSLSLRRAASRYALLEHRPDGSFRDVSLHRLELLVAVDAPRQGSIVTYTTPLRRPSGHGTATSDASPIDARDEDPSAADGDDDIARVLPDLVRIFRGQTESWRREQFVRGTKADLAGLARCAGAAVLPADEHAHIAERIQRVFSDADADMARFVLVPEAIKRIMMHRDNLSSAQAEIRMLLAGDTASEPRDQHDDRDRDEQPSAQSPTKRRHRLIADEDDPHSAD